MRKLGVILGAVLLSIGGINSANADVTGVWATVDGKSHVKIESCDGDKYCGEIIWLKEPNDKAGAPKKDINNRDETKHGRGIVGIKILKGLEKTGENEWDDGYIYNPEDGETYGSEMALIEANVLEVKGCILFMCREQIWNRVK